MKLFLIYGLFMMGLLSPTEWLRYNRDNARSEKAPEECLLRQVKDNRQMCQVLPPIASNSRNSCAAALFCKQATPHKPVAPVKAVSVQPATTPQATHIPWKIFILLKR